MYLTWQKYIVVQHFKEMLYVLHLLFFLCWYLHICFAAATRRGKKHLIAKEELLSPTPVWHSVAPGNGDPWGPSNHLSWLVLSRNMVHHDTFAELIS